MHYQGKDHNRPQRLVTLRSLRAFLLISFAFLFVCAKKRENFTDLKRLPPTQITSAISLFQEQQDERAYFSLIDGHVSVFATRPSTTVPAYAEPILKAAGLLTTQPYPSANIVDFVADGNAETEGQVTDSLDGQEGNSEFDFETQWEKERPIALQVLIAFLRENAVLFEITPEQLQQGLPMLKISDYKVNRFFRELTGYQEYKGIPVHDGKTLIRFDHNWNVVFISRMLITPEKNRIPSDPKISPDEAKILALKRAEELQIGSGITIEGSPTLLVEPLTQNLLWFVRFIDEAQGLRLGDMQVNALNGEIIHYVPLVAHQPGDGNNPGPFPLPPIPPLYTNATALAWRYLGGSYTAPQQVKYKLYSIGADFLQDKYFSLFNDEVGQGNQAKCLGFGKYRPGAYGPDTGDYIAPTHAQDMTFVEQPDALSGTFAESHTFVWAQRYFRWIEKSLTDVGALIYVTKNGLDLTNYHPIQIVVNSCSDGTVTIPKAGQGSPPSPQTENNLGEKNAVWISLGEQCRTSTLSDTPPTGGAGDIGKCFPKHLLERSSHITCEGGGCYRAPGTLSHELNHATLMQFFQIYGTNQCGAKEQELGYIHEGVLGFLIPNMFNHHYNNIGYAATPAENYYFSPGKPHSSLFNKLTKNSYPCNDTDISNTGPSYLGGHTVGQALWEIYHGKIFVEKWDSDPQSDSSQILSGELQVTWRVTKTRDFLDILYTALKATAAADKQNRQTFAEQFMIAMKSMSAAPTEALAMYCGAFGHHGYFIDQALCQ